MILRHPSHSFGAWLLVLCLAALPALAQDKRATPSASADGKAWATLTPGQQAALAPLKRDWQSIDAARQQKWLEVAARFPSMPADERERVQARMSEWARLSPEERGRARLQFQEARQLSPQERQVQWEAYQALTPEQRSALASRATPAPKPAGAKPAPAASAPGAPAANARTKPTPVTPTMVQAKPGASTTLISKTTVPPAHASPAKPSAARAQVDSSTLLPRPGAAASAPRKSP